MVLLQLSETFRDSSWYRNRSRPVQTQAVESHMLGYWGWKCVWWEFFEGKWKWVSVGSFWWVCFSTISDTWCWNYSWNHWFLRQWCRGRSWLPNRRVLFNWAGTQYFTWGKGKSFLRHSIFADYFLLTSVELQWLISFSFSTLKSAKKLYLPCALEK